MAVKVKEISGIQCHQAQLVQAIIDVGKFLALKGWVPASSGNFSAKASDQTVALTASGRNKGALTPNDILVVDLDGHKVEGEGNPSAEMLLHTTLYHYDQSIGAVLHTHSHNSVILSRWLMQQGKDSLVMEGYELLKAFAGIHTHEMTVSIPIFKNSQDMTALSKEVIERISGCDLCIGYIIEGHGLYTWGKDIAAAQIAIEALETLLAYALYERLPEKTWGF